MKYIIVTLGMLAAALGAANAPMTLDGLVIRPESMTQWFIGNGGSKTYFENVDSIIGEAQKLHPRVLYVEFRAVDSAMNGKNGRPDMRGALYFSPKTPIPYVKVYKTMAPYNEDFADPKYLHYLVDKAHAAGMKVSAWFPTFNDRPLWQAKTEFQMRPLSSADPDGETFVSPASRAVRDHEKQVIAAITSQFDVDGVTLDWIRYTQEDQPQDEASAALYRAQYHAEISGPARGGRSNPQWKRFLDFRADLLVSFFGEVKALCQSRKNFELAAFLMPHTGKVGEADAVGGLWGYAYEPWSGVDYLKLAKTGFTLMPMIYWDKQLGWGKPWKTWQQFTEKMSENLQQWIQGGPSRYVPCYSAVYPVDELVQGFQLARKHGVNAVTMFYYGEWNKPWPATSQGDKLSDLAKVLEEVNKPGR